MLYAVVDIETTGGHALAHGITEIAINIYDGSEVIERFSTLINPKKPIPAFITALTGIDAAMVQGAPEFRHVAHKIYSLLKDKIFIAHNVNFDYSFLKYHLAMSGYALNCKKLCTVRLSRKLQPGLPSYSLGKLCSALNIPVQNRHRAAGDADATTLLLALLLKCDANNIISEMIKKTSKEHFLPPNLNKKDISNLPDTPGVYYFKNNKGKVIYVGKAINIKKRVISHFTGNAATKQRQEFMRNIYKIDFLPCGTELMAFILEASEIKKLWPEHNSSMKRYQHKFDLYVFEDQNGYLRLAIDKSKKEHKSQQSFNSRLDGMNYLNRLAAKYALCPKLCCLHKDACAIEGQEGCSGACRGAEEPDVYNARLLSALQDVERELPNFVLIDSGRAANESSYVLVENGKFYGMGYINQDEPLQQSIENIKEQLQPYPSDNYVLNLILNHAVQYPEKLYRLNNSAYHDTLNGQLDKTLAVMC